MSTLRERLERKPPGFIYLDDDDYAEVLHALRAQEAEPYEDDPDTLLAKQPPGWPRIVYMARHQTLDLFLGILSALTAIWLLCKGLWHR